MLLVAVACSALTGLAHEGYRSVLINLSNGAAMSVNLSDGLSAVFGRNDLVISDKGKTVLQVPRASIVSFSHSQEFASVDATDASAATHHTIDGNMLKFASLAPGAAVELFDASGKLQHTAVADAEGTAVIDLSTLAKGVTIVTVNHTLNFKIAIP